METAFIAAFGVFATVIAMGVFGRDEDPTLSPKQKADMRQRETAEALAIAEYEAELEQLRSSKVVRD